jgi:hypothetical protein
VSKGDWQRPAAVSGETVRQNYDAIRWDDQPQKPQRFGVAADEYALLAEQSTGIDQVEYAIIDTAGNLLRARVPLDALYPLPADGRPDCRACDNTRMLDAHPFPEPCAFCAEDD